MTFLRKRRSNAGGCLCQLLLLSLCIWGCDRLGGGLPEGILAQVNQEQITVEAFLKEIKDAILEPTAEAKGDALGELRRAYLDQIIERKILAQEARRLGIKVSPEELNQAIFEIRKDYPEKGFDERLGLKGTTIEEWKARLEEKLLAEKMVRSALHYAGDISEKEALQYYEVNRTSFTIGPRVRASQIVVADGEEAIQILKRLKKGESFEKLAREKSLGPEKSRGGDLGFFSQGEKPAEFDLAFTMEVGSISDVIQSPYGYHLFKVTGKIKPREISFEEAKPRIFQELKKRKEEEEYQRWFKDLRKKADVKINKKWFRS